DEQIDSVAAVKGNILIANRKLPLALEGDPPQLELPRKTHLVSILQKPRPDRAVNSIAAPITAGETSPITPSSSFAVPHAPLAPPAEENPPLRLCGERSPTYPAALAVR